MTTATSQPEDRFDKIKDLDGLIQLRAVKGCVRLPVDFLFFDQDHLVVYEQTTAGATPSILTISTDYTVFGARRETGGYVELTTAAAGGEVYTIQRVVPIERTDDYSVRGSFFAEDENAANKRPINEELDYIYMMLQQLGTFQFYGIRLSTKLGDSLSVLGEGLIDRLNTVIGFDASGDNELKEGGDGITISGGNVTRAAGTGTDRLIARQVFTSSDTYTPTSGATKGLVMVLGAGAGGAQAFTGDAPEFDGSSFSIWMIGGLGGNGGAVAYKAFDIGDEVDEVASATVTVGAGGTGGIGTGSLSVDPTAGGDSSFEGINDLLETIFTVTGGGGPASADGTTQGAKATATGGDINQSGREGRPGYTPVEYTGFISSSVQTWNPKIPSNGAIYGGPGGDSPFGSGGLGGWQQINNVGADCDGKDAGGYGGGGGGAVARAANQTTGRDGGDGSGGLVIVWEFA